MSQNIGGRNWQEFWRKRSQNCIRSFTGGSFQNNFAVNPRTFWGGGGTMAQTFRCDGHVGRNMQHILTLNYTVKLRLFLRACCFSSWKEGSKLLSISPSSLNAFFNESYFFLVRIINFAFREAVSVSASNSWRNAGLYNYVWQNQTVIHNINFTYTPLDAIPCFHFMRDGL